MLDVQVDDPVLVQELQGFQHLSRNHSALSLSQGNDLSDIVPNRSDPSDSILKACNKLEDESDQPQG